MTEYYPVESAEEQTDGVVVVRLRVVDPAWLTRLVLRLGGAAEILEPADLAAAVRSTAREALEQYG